MSYPINYPTPQGANVQIFTKSSTNQSQITGSETWVKPQGASFVWFTLIGAGGGGNTDLVYGGGSGAVTNFMGPAFLMPDSLQIEIGVGGQAQSGGSVGGDTYVRYAQKSNSAPYVLLRAQGGGTSSNGGQASASNYFSCMGIYQSVAGQNGVAGDPGASSTTFLSGGGAGGTVTANYGYGGAITNGYFQMQPIIVGVGAGGTGRSGVGCGGSPGGTSRGGDGLVVIITW